jgi:hypothetical protein
VLVLGFAEAMAHDQLLISAWETGPVPGLTGFGTCTEITPRKITGSVRARSYA